MEVKRKPRKVLVLFFLWISAPLISFFWKNYELCVASDSVSKRRRLLWRNCGYECLSLCSQSLCYLLEREKVKQSHSVSLQPTPTSPSRCAEALGRLGETEKSCFPLRRNQSSFWHWEHQHPAAGDCDVARHWAPAVLLGVVFLVGFGPHHPPPPPPKRNWMYLQSGCIVVVICGNCGHRFVRSSIFIFLNRSFVRQRIWSLQLAP